MKFFRSDKPGSVFGIGFPWVGPAIYFKSDPPAPEWARQALLTMMITPAQSLAKIAKAMEAENNKHKP